MSHADDTPAPGGRAHLKTVEEFHTHLTKLRAELVGLGEAFRRGHAVPATDDVPRELRLVDALAGNIESIIAPAVDEHDSAAEQYAETLGTVTLPDGRAMDYSLATVRAFRDVTVTVEIDNPGRRRGTTTETVRVFLPPDAYGRVADRAAAVGQTLGVGLHVVDDSGADEAETDYSDIL